MQEPPFDLMALPASTRVDPLIQAFADYWWSKHALRDAVPDRADLDPLIEVPDLVPHIFLMDVLDGGADFRTRLIGTQIVAHYGRDSTGRKISEMTSGIYLEAILGLFRDTIRAREPIYSVTNYLHPERDYLLVERLNLPLRRGGEEIAMLAVMQRFHTSHYDIHFGDVVDRLSADATSFHFNRYRLPPSDAASEKQGHEQ